MLTIRRAQLASFEAALWDQFTRRLIEQAREDNGLPEPGASDAELFALLRPVLGLAAQYGLISKDDVARYGRLVLALGRDPQAADAAIVAALNNPLLMGADKLTALEQAMG
ncbi:hypothetical protein LNV09_17510 [Paucibacter sp. B2R-40]|uniref:hypothetical protein n=1 Tax=Paucibacter sp. B2R-40 TaxID=2893554 RepID=UPI0021E471E9|nr:hypothetical protein [Paucibacter sp. B2R-40]MCV2355942.1 hypothetical protein [Paucibacter sp. B2R-40]